MEITLIGAEMLVLRETVEKAIREMLMEIANTDNRKMREGLREREEILKRFLEKLPAEVRTAA
jgi:predicted house-cleaning noncanonical NTP pyrophosphatase (MazG superfamily)